MSAEKEDRDFSIDLIDKSILIDGKFDTCGNSSTSFHLRFDRPKLFMRFRVWVAVNEKGAFATMRFAFS